MKPSPADLKPVACPELPIGSVRDRLTIRAVGRGPKYVLWAVCDCSCGTREFVTSAYGVINSVIRGCGCLNRDSKIKHGLCSHPLYGLWHQMMARCYRPKHKAYKDYGGRGITVTKRWHKLANFVADMAPSYQPDLELDRKNVNLGYSKRNCRWATRLEQANNRTDSLWITHNGETKTLSEWSRALGLEYNFLFHRIYRAGWSPTKAFTTPKQV